MSVKAFTFAKLTELCREFKCVKRVGYFPATNRLVIYLDIRFKWYTWFLRWKRRKVWDALEDARPVGISFKPAEQAVTWLDLSETGGG